MKAGDFVEKRRFKRLDLSLPVQLRRVSSDGKEKEDTKEAHTLNVSYNGAYIINIKLKDIKPNDNLQITLSVPRDEARDFPFSRIAGKAKVVRVEKDGAALEFDENISRLFIAN